MTKEIEEYLQSTYEDILSEYWHKVLQVRELEETNKANHPLRLVSIKNRKKELSHILKKREAIEFMYSDWISVPIWFDEICEEHNIEKN